MRTLQFVSERKQKIIAQETLEVYAPLAHRLGMNEVKVELENLCLYYINRTEFNIVSDLVNERINNFNFDILDVINSIKKLLEDNDIPHTKNIFKYSII